MGSPDFAVPALQALVDHSPEIIPPYKIVGVVTQPDRPSGRGRSLLPPPVKSAALELGLPLMQPEKLRAPAAMQVLVSWSPDLIIVSAFGQILRPEVLDLPKFGCLNIHGSLLPRWRGAAPIQAAILAGDHETGITIMKMDPGIDTGPVISHRSIPIAPGETAGTLFTRLAPLGAQLLIETLPAYLSNELRPLPQPETGATYARMLKKEDGLLDFNQPALDLERQVRAFNPWPGAYLVHQGEPLKIQLASLVPGSFDVGKPFIHHGFPAVGTSNGALVLEQVQPPGKKPMSGKSFLAGGRNWD